MAAGTRLGLTARPGGPPPASPPERSVPPNQWTGLPDTKPGSPHNGNARMSMGYPPGRRRSGSRTKAVGNPAVLSRQRRRLGSGATGNMVTACARSAPGATAPTRSLVLCFVNTVFVMPSTRRHLARIDDEGAPDSCIEEEDAARGVEGRQNVIEFTERCTSARARTCRATSCRQRDQTRPRGSPRCRFEPRRRMS